MRWWVLPITALALVVTRVAGSADDGLVLRASGFVRGQAEITPERIRCEVPGPSSAIPDGTFALGLLDTFGVPTRFFPDPQNPYANPCGGWLRVESALRAQGLTIGSVRLRYHVRASRQVRRSVDLRHGLPLSCRGLRQTRVAVALRLEPPLPGAEGAAAPGFVPLVPMVSPVLLRCLQQALLPGPMASIPLIILARATGRADSGQIFTSNAAGYTLTLVIEGAPLLDGPVSG